MSTSWQRARWCANWDWPTAGCPKPASPFGGFAIISRLVEVIPDWRFRTYDLSLVQIGNRHITKPCRLFKDLAVQMAPSLFPDLPT
jgi:hypothetical protein